MSSRKKRSARATIVRAVVSFVALVVAGSVAASVGAAAPPSVADDPLLQPIDEQHWVDQGELTWAAYTKVRPDSWLTDAAKGSVSQFRGAVVLAEFTDQPFLISQAPGSHPFGNPQPGWQPVVDVRQWMTTT